MRLNKLEIKGFKGFKEPIVIDFSGNNLTIFVGINGAGKTALLEAVGIFLLHIKSKTLSRDAPVFRNYFINVDSEKANINICFDFDNKESLLTNIEIIRINGGFRTYAQSKIDFSEFYLSVKSSENIPIIVYYPTERSVTRNVKENQSDFYENQFKAWEGAIKRNTDFNDFLVWFRETEDLENEIRLNDNIQYFHPPLQAVRNSILGIIEGFSNLRVKRHNRKKPEIVIEKKGVQLSVNQLSHGEKTLLALVGDLARRLAIANPGLEKPLEGKGVVLIDEIDLHLHPKWQKNTIAKLQNTFPNIQFILTTHSPIIISQLKPESIFLLEDNVVTPLISKGVNSYGLTIEDVLLKIQGTSELLPKDVDTQFRELFDLIEEGKLKEAKKLKAKLEHLVEPAHPELLKGDANIKFKELLS